MQINKLLKVVSPFGTVQTYWKLRTKMLLLSGIVLAGFTLSTIMTVYILNQVKVGGVKYQHIINDKDSLEQIALLMSNLNQIRAEVINLIAETDADKMKTASNTLLSLEEEINAKFGSVSKIVDTEEKRVAVQDAEATWKEFAETLKSDVIPAINQNNRTKARELATEVQAKRYERFIEQISALVDSTKLEIDEQEAAVKKAISYKIALTAAVSGGIFICILIAFMVVTRSVTAPILQGVRFALSVAGGNLTETLDARRGDEIGELVGALNGMVFSLNGMVGKINQSAADLANISGNVNDAALRVVNATQIQASGVNETSSAVTEISISLKEVANLVDMLSQSAGESSSSILEMAASVEEVALNMDTLSKTVGDVSSSILQMTSSVKQVSEGVATLMEASSQTASSMSEMDSSIKQVEMHATDTAGITAAVRRDAENGKIAVEATIVGIEEIKLSSQVTDEVISTLSKRTDDIGAILAVIDDVAGQTNLLALNAAIIAAQAGEQGKGFAVVADEIKQLSERTRTSTKEIAQLVTWVQEETMRAVAAINKAKKSISNGVELSANAGAALNKIVAGAEKANGQMAEIARATAEQTRGSQTIREAMERVTNMVEQFANASREQIQSSELIIGAVGSMEELSLQVRNSTREQSKVGKVIATSTESITVMIQQIKRACDEQSRGSEQIVMAIENIQESTQDNLNTTTIMNDTATNLAHQVEFLHQEMKSFQV